MTSVEERLKRLEDSVRELMDRADGAEERDERLESRVSDLEDGVQELMDRAEEDEVGAHGASLERRVKALEDICNPKGQRDAIVRAAIGELDKSANQRTLAGDRARIDS